MGKTVPVYVLVSGLPGSGKTTIAAPVAGALRWPLVARDPIKEALWDVLGPGDVAWSRQLGAASGEVFMRVAATVRPAVLENFFHAHGRGNVAALGGPFVEVHCACPVEVARARYRARERHPCHFDLEYGVPAFERWAEEDAHALALGPVLELDTTHGVDIDNVVAWIRSELPQ
jgi:glucokinase